MIAKEQWKKVEEQLAGMFGWVKFKIDAYEVTVQRERMSESVTNLAIYIDDELCFGNGMPNSKVYMPITEKLWRKKSRKKYATKFINDTIKIYGKRRALKEYPDLYDKAYSLDPIFNTAKSLCRQYKKIDGLELLSIGYEKVVNETGADAKNTTEGVA